LAALIVGNLLANQVQAQGAPQTQPLTRLDCAKAGMAWDDTANVCVVAAQAAEARTAQGAAPRSEGAHRLNQPLTRHDCAKAGMAWDDTTNVCSAESAETAIQSDPQEPEALAPTVLVNINKADQRMTVIFDGKQRYEWPVSTGLRGYTTPSGTYTARSMNKIWYSREWDNAPMPHAIFFTKRGHAIHGTEETNKLGRPASHGCVRLAPEHARTLFTLVKANGLEHTQIVLGGDTPGGEAKVASPTPSKKRATRTREYSKFERLEVPRRFGRRGWFKRHYAAPRGLPPQPFYMGRQRSRR
jgi:lipoprotein-anchoring transpeptidase ErfK/SrfK